MSSEATPAGGHALVQLRLESPVVARAGDRVVIRSYSPVHTIAGGRVLEPVASKRRRVSDDAAAALNALVGALTGGRDAVTPDRAAAAVTAAVALQGPGGATVAALPLLCGLQPSLVRATLESLTDSGTLVTTGERVLDGQCVRHVEEAILRHTAAFHAEHTSRDGVEREAVRRALAAATADLFDVSLDRLVATGRLTVTGALLALPGHSARLSPDAQHALERLAGIYAAAALQAPDLAELPPDLAARRDLASLLRLLERDGRVLRLSATRWISAQAVADGIAAIAAHLPSGQPLEVSDFKQVVNLTRKHLIPFLEHLDRIGVTRRDGGSRVLS